MKSFEETIHKDEESISFRMIHVEGGLFQMGSNEGHSDEKPIHEVTIPKEGFLIGQFPVTQSLYEFVTGENPARFKGSDRPVENVSWHDAQTFIKMLNNLTKKEYRLPSESEWEFAARGGIHWKDDFKYSGSNDVREVAWYNDTSHEETKPVGLLEPNQLGIHDMSGNLYEWCEDYWHRDYNNAPQDGSAWDDMEDSASRVIRGGSWILNSQYCRVAVRYYYHPSRRYDFIGFRLVLSQ